MRAPSSVFGAGSAKAREASESGFISPKLAQKARATADGPGGEVS